MGGKSVTAVFGILTAFAALPSRAAEPAPFNARMPTDVYNVLITNGASGELKTGDDGVKYIDGKSGDLEFDVDFYKCNDAKVDCDVVIYQLGYDTEMVTLDQLNAWNRWTYMCPAFLTEKKHPHVWIGLRPSAHDTRDDVIAQQKTWLRCLRDFDQFANDPDTFIKTVIGK